MNVYVDASVVLRVVLGEPRKLSIWKRIEHAVSSELITVECLRTVDRARIRLSLGDEEVADRRSSVMRTLEGIDVVPIVEPILRRAAEPFPTTLGSLDAIHLASALAAREAVPELTLATHDAELALAARAVGFEVSGIAAR